MHTCVCIWGGVYAYVSMCIWGVVCAYGVICMHICVCVHMEWSVCIHECVHIGWCVCIHVCVHIGWCVCIHVCVHMGWCVCIHVRGCVCAYGAVYAYGGCVCVQVMCVHHLAGQKLATSLVSLWCCSFLSGHQLILWAAVAGTAEPAPSCQAGWQHCLSFHFCCNVVAGGRWG